MARAKQQEALAEAPRKQRKRRRKRVAPARRSSRTVRSFAALGMVKPVVTGDLGAVRYAGLPLWAWASMGAVAVGGGIWVFAVMRRKKMIPPEQQSLFIASLPEPARRYGPEILRASQDQGVDPFIIYALGDRESKWGEAKAYKQETGDWTPRERTLVTAKSKPGVYRIVEGPYTRTDSKGITTSYVKVMPADGLGWGRGLMQIDWEWQNDWVTKNNWKDPYTNIRYGTTYLKQLLGMFGSKKAIGKVAPGNGLVDGVRKDPRPLTGKALRAAAIAAYNTGPANAIRNLSKGLSAEASTTGGDYTTDTIRRHDELVAAFTAAGGSVQAVV